MTTRFRLGFAQELNLQKKKRKFRIILLFSLLYLSHFSVTSTRAGTDEHFESGSVIITITQTLILEDRDDFPLGSGEIFLEVRINYLISNESLQKLNEPLNLSTSFDLTLTSDKKNANDGDTIEWGWKVFEKPNIVGYYVEVHVKESDVGSDNKLGKVILHREDLPQENQTLIWYNAEDPEGGTHDLQAKIEIEEVISNRHHFTRSVPILDFLTTFCGIIFIGLFHLFHSHFSTRKNRK